MEWTLKRYIVERGDYLTKIIKKMYGSCSPKLLKMVMSANDLSDPNKIQIGQVILMPGRWGEHGLEPTMIRLEGADVTSLVTKTKPSGLPSVGGASTTMTDQILPSGDYWKELFHKNLMMLHFTAGYTAKSAIATFRQPGRVATAFVLDTDGKIYRLFDERYWSYHIGVRGRDAENWFHDKRSIGIEVVNIGPVWNRGGVWKDYVGKTYNPSQIVQGSNRDAQGGVKFPEVQMVALAGLMNHLMMKYDIPRQIPRDFMSFQLPALRRFEGVVSHQNFRTDKYDMGIAFVQEWLPAIIAECGLKVAA